EDGGLRGDPFATRYPANGTSESRMPSASRPPITIDIARGARAGERLRAQSGTESGVLSSTQRTSFGPTFLSTSRAPSTRRPAEIGSSANHGSSAGVDSP